MQYCIQRIGTYSYIQWTGSNFTEVQDYCVSQGWTCVAPDVDETIVVSFNAPDTLTFDLLLNYYIIGSSPGGMDPGNFSIQYQSVPAAKIDLGVTAAS